MKDQCFCWISNMFGRPRDIKWDRWVRSWVNIWSYIWDWNTEDFDSWVETDCSTAENKTNNTTRKNSVVVFAYAKKLIKAMTFSGWRRGDPLPWYEYICLSKLLSPRTLITSTGRIATSLSWLLVFLLCEGRSDFVSFGSFGQRAQCILFSVVFTLLPRAPCHHGSVWLLHVISLLLTNNLSPVADLPIRMIGEVSWEPKRRRAWPLNIQPSMVWYIQ